jgi:hypothetical protein
MHNQDNSEYQPFTYLTTNTAGGQFYHGSRYCKGAHPDQLWTVYFTSSKTVQQMIEEKGPDIWRTEITGIYTTREETLKAEKEFVKKDWGNPLLLNKVIPGDNISDFTGTIAISKDNTIKFIQEKDIDLFLSNGWHLGFGTEGKYIRIFKDSEMRHHPRKKPLPHRWTTDNPDKGRVTYIFKDGRYKRHLKEEPIPDGWLLSGTTIVMHKELEDKHVKKEEFHLYLAAGWKKGSCKDKNYITLIDGTGVIRKQPDDELIPNGWRKGGGNYVQGKIAINKNNRVKYIEKEELSKHLQDRWTEGNIELKYIHTGDITSSIPKDQPIPDGWLPGRKNNEKTVVHNTIEAKIINHIELDRYIQQGWQKRLHDYSLIIVVNYSTLEAKLHSKNEPIPDGYESIIGKHKRLSIKKLKQSAKFK